jgi:hypothetical protein
MRHHILGAAALLINAVAIPVSAQTPPPPGPTTAVLVNLTIRPEVDRQQLMKVMPEEVRATVKLYLDGKIQQWYSRSDGRGVMFILNASTVNEAKAIMEDLPLSKANLNNLEYTPLGPLSPLRALIAAPPAAPKNQP